MKTTNWFWLTALSSAKKINWLYIEMFSFYNWTLQWMKSLENTHARSHKKSGWSRKMVERLQKVATASSSGRCADSSCAIQPPLTAHRLFVRNVHWSIRSDVRVAVCVFSIGTLVQFYVCCEFILMCFFYGIVIYKLREC